MVYTYVPCTPPFSCISSFWDCFARFEVGSICIWFPTSRKITPIIFCLKSFLENIDIGNFFVRNGRWPESARKSRKRQNINGVPIVTHAENASKLPKNTERSESKVTSKLPTGVLKEMVYRYVPCPPPFSYISTSFLGELVWCRGNKWFIPMSHAPPLSHAFPVFGIVSQGSKWVPFAFDFQPPEK